MIVEATKLCGGKHGCGQVLPVGEFSYRKSGFDTYCRACNAAKGGRWKRENPDRARLADKRWKRKNPGKTRANSQRWKRKNPIRVKAHNLKLYAHSAGPSDIDLDWIMERLDRGVCELKGIPFVYESGHPFMPSIDRIDATQTGHMKDNCRIVLWGLNGFKGTASEEVFLKCLEAVSATPNKG